MKNMRKYYLFFWFVEKLVNKVNDFLQPEWILIQVLFCKNLGYSEKNECLCLLFVVNKNAEQDIINILRSSASLLQ